jgi:hypothetical protein
LGKKLRSDKKVACLVPELPITPVVIRILNLCLIKKNDEKKAHLRGCLAPLLMCVQIQKEVK